MTEIKASFITKSPRSMASRRYRIDAVCEQLAVNHGMLAGAREFGAVDDNVRIYSKHFNFCDHAEAQWFKQGGGKVIYDVCDQHIYDDPVGPHYRRMIDAADLVICATAEIQRVVLSRAVPGKTRTCHIPDMVLGTRCEYTPPKGELQYLWYGHPSNLPRLLEVLPAFEGRRLEVICNPLPPAGYFQNANVKLNLTEWSEQAVKEGLLRANFVVVPQRQDEQGRAKGANRVLESIWAGVPVICDATPEVDIVNSKDCFIGLIVRNPEAWKSAVENVSTMAKQTQWMDYFADTQDHIGRAYSPEHMGNKWADAIMSVAG